MFFLASGCVQGLVEKPNIWQAAQSHILVEQTHTHTHLSKVHLPLLHSYIYTSPQSTFIYTHIKYIGTFQNLQKLFGLSRSPFQKSHMGGVEYYLPMTGYQNHFDASSRHLENNRSSGSSPDWAWRACMIFFLGQLENCEKKHGISVSFKHSRFSRVQYDSISPHVVNFNIWNAETHKNLIDSALEQGNETFQKEKHRSKWQNIKYKNQNMHLPNISDRIMTAQKSQQCQFLFLTSVP